MAQTEHLPIYKSAYDLCLYFEQVVRDFSRYHKYSIGADLRDGAREGDSQSFMVNSGFSPIKHLGCVRPYCLGEAIPLEQASRFIYRSFIKNERYGRVLP